MMVHPVVDDVLLVPFYISSSAVVNLIPVFGSHLDSSP